MTVVLTREIENQDEWRRPPFFRVDIPYRADGLPPHKYDAAHDPILNRVSTDWPADFLGPFGDAPYEAVPRLVQKITDTSALYVLTLTYDRRFIGGYNKFVTGSVFTYEPLVVPYYRLGFVEVPGGDVAYWTRTPRTERRRVSYFQMQFPLAGVNVVDAAIRLADATDGLYLLTGIQEARVYALAHATAELDRQNQVIVNARLMRSSPRNGFTRDGVDYPALGHLESWFDHQLDPTDAPMIEVIPPCERYVNGDTQVAAWLSQSGNTIQAVECE